jgi:ribosome biogenesis GTPase
MIALPDGGLVIDTPGMRELQLWGVDDTLSGSFDDVAALGATCKFRDCRHGREPGCAVKAAVEAGTLDAARYDNFLKLQGEQEALDRRQDERALLEQKRAGKLGAKALRALQKDRER